MAGIEPATSSLPRTRSTPELHERGILLPATRGQFTPRDRFIAPEGNGQRRQKRAEPIKALYTVKKKVKWKEIRQKRPKFRGYKQYRPLLGSRSKPQGLNQNPFSRQLPLFRGFYRSQNIIHSPDLPPSPYHFARPPPQSLHKFAQVPWPPEIL